MEDTPSIFEGSALVDAVAASCDALRSELTKYGALLAELKELLAEQRAVAAAGGEGAADAAAAADRIQTAVAEVQSVLAKTSLMAGGA